MPQFLFMYDAMAYSLLPSLFRRVLLRKHPCNGSSGGHNLTSILLPLGIIAGVVVVLCTLGCLCRNKNPGPSSEHQELTSVNDNKYYHSKDKSKTRRDSHDSNSSGGAGGGF